MKTKKNRQDDLETRMSRFLGSLTPQQKEDFEEILAAMAQPLTDLLSAGGFDAEGDFDDDFGSFCEQLTYEKLCEMGIPHGPFVHSSVPRKHLIVKISLDDVKPPVWRKLRVPTNMSLEAFAHVVMLAMGWSGSHLHQFRKGRKFYSCASQMGCGGLNDVVTDNMVVGDLLMEKGDSIKLDYDFGDGWSHTIKVMEEPVDYAQFEPAQVDLIGGKRACPMEDCGGPLGYEEFLRDPDNDWFDPDEFYLEEVDNEVDMLLVSMQMAAEEPKSKPESKPAGQKKVYKS